MQKDDCQKSFELNQSILEKKMKVDRPLSVSKNEPFQPLKSKPSVFSQKDECELIDYVQQLQKILFRLTIHDVRSLAEQILIKNKKNEKPRPHAYRTGQLWVTGFLKRYPKVTLRIPSITNTTMDFNMTELQHFYIILSNIYELQKITPDRIYNTDDITISITAKDNNTFISVGNNTTAYRSVVEKETISAKICVDANGLFLPSMVILPLKHFQAHPLINTSKETWTNCTDNGYIETETFSQWLRKFITYSGAKKDHPVLLLFDGQPAYIKSIEIINIARENGIIMLSFPPGTRHLLQPLNEEFVNSLNMCYGKEVDSWLQCNPEQTVSTAQVADLFHRALNQAASSKNTAERFKTCGIFPLNSTIFKESDFVPPISNKVEIYEQKTPPPTKTFRAPSFIAKRTYYFDIYKDPKPGCSFWTD